MNILLTGGAGYIGSHAALSLLDDGHKVHIIDNLSTGNEMLIPRSAKFTNCNINNEEVISNLIQSNNFDLLMHFAGFIQVEESGNHPDKYFENNDICFSLKLISNSRYSHSLNLILEQIKISSLSLTTHNLFWLLIRILNCPQWKITWGVFFLIVGKTLSCNLIIFLSIQE